MNYRERFWDLLRPLELFICSVLWMEIIFRLFYIPDFFDRGLLYILLFSLPIAAICTFVCSLWGEKHNRLVAGVLLAVMTLWFVIQAVYNTIFHTMLVTKSFGMAGQAIGNYWRETLLGIFKAIPAIVLLAVPFGLFICLRRHVTLSARADKWELAALAGGALLLQLLAVACIHLPAPGVMTTRELYRQSFIPELSASRFGVMTTLRLDISQSLFGLDTPDDDLLLPDTSGEDESGDVSVQAPIQYRPNVLDIDFEALAEAETNKTLKNMHLYFAGREPTYQNEYTGLFEGKNLIMLTGEAFWIGAVDPVYTPTLYKLANEGFVFKNFYNPLWWYSTIDGEYAHCTGLIPFNKHNPPFKYTGKNKNCM